MKRIFLFLSFLLLVISLPAQQQKFSRLRIYTDDEGLRRLSEAGVTVDHGERKTGSWFVSDFSETEQNTITRLGFAFDVLISDVASYYTEQNTSARTNNAPEDIQAAGCSSATAYTVPNEFNYGSMGGFFTYNELMAHLDSMAARYPNLVKPRIAIDSAILTQEGRYVYWLKISDNPAVDENEPEVLFTALHHAREPCGASALIMFMYYLLENYATNPEIQYLVDNTEIYFVPCVNPDGYIYNQTTNPNGGGMWRKNRRDNLDGSYGVDLNRNYGYQFAYDNVGSSNVTSDDTYRGPSGFSEPETHCIENFCNAHQFRMAINYHTYSNVLIYPWGYDASLTPDATTFSAYAKILTSENGFGYGTAMQTVGYNANGDSDDWMYGEQSSKPKIYAMTPEAGDPNDGFWPAQNRIIPLCLDNLGANINTLRLLHAYATGTSTDSRYIGSLNGQVHFDVQRLGLDSPAVYTASIVPISSWITAVGSPRTYSGLSLLQQVSDSIAYTLNAATPAGATIQYILSISNGTFATTDTITRIFGQPVPVFTSNGNSMSGWTSSTWNTTTTTFYSATSSITDSPSGNYPQNANTNITTSSSINLAGALSANLRYHAKWDLEANYDYTQIQVSTDNGANWTSLCGKYTSSVASLNNGNPLYTAVQSNWVAEEVSLDNYTGMNILLRFRLRSDFGVQQDGYYFDDLVVEKIDTTTSVGISEFSNQIFIGDAQPNPATSETFIPLANAGQQAQIEITDALGRIVLTEKIPVDSHGAWINTTTLPQGMYTCRIRGAQTVSATKRFVIAR